MVIWRENGLVYCTSIHDGVTYYPRNEKVVLSATRFVVRQAAFTQTAVIEPIEPAWARPGWIDRTRGEWEILLTPTPPEEVVIEDVFVKLAQGNRKLVEKVINA